MTCNNDLFTSQGLQSLGIHLKTVRQFKGYSRKEAAEKSAVSLAWLQKLELGTLESTPRKETLEKYCKFLGCSIKLQYNYSFNTNKKERRSMTQLISLDEIKTLLEAGYTLVTIGDGILATNEEAAKNAGVSPDQVEKLGLYEGDTVTIYYNDPSTGKVSEFEVWNWDTVYKIIK